MPIDPNTGVIAAIADARRRHGDNFVVHSGSDHYLFAFSPAGVESFYALPEEKARKGFADYSMLRRKLPDEIFDGRRVLPNPLFRRNDVASYLDNLHWALDKAWPNRSAVWPVRPAPARSTTCCAMMPSELSTDVTRSPSRRRR